VLDVAAVDELALALEFELPDLCDLPDLLLEPPELAALFVGALVDAGVVAAPPLPPPTLTTCTLELVGVGDDEDALPIRTPIPIASSRVATPAIKVVPAENRLLRGAGSERVVVLVTAAAVGAVEVKRACPRRSPHSRQ
jgi:hypothetical protein